MKNKKIQNIKDKAVKNKPALGDYTEDIKLYQKQIKFIQKELLAGEDDISELKKKFIKSKSDTLSKQDLKPVEKAKEIYKAFMKYMIECVKLNRIGKAIVIVDKEQGKYLEIVTKNKMGSDETERIIAHRENMVIRSMIQSEAKELLNNVISTVDETQIMKWLNPYYKIFSPKAKKIDNVNFNVYTPNGFLEIDVKNCINLDNFVDNILPTKYPHINALLDNLSPKIEEKKYIINWLSYILNTSSKTRNALVFLGIQGGGKGVFQQILEYALHVDNCYTATNEDIKSAFNGYIENRVFIFFNEIKGSFSESSTQADKIKPFITDSHISLNDKYKKQVYIENHANCMFFSNHDLPFQIEDKDRRYSVIKTNNKTLVDVAKDKFSITIGKFINAIEKERESFLIEMKMIEYKEELALSLLDNEVKRKIKEQTNTVKEIIKDKIVDKDYAWFEKTISDLIAGSEDEKIEDKRVKKEIINSENGDKSVIDFVEMFKFTNEEFKNFMINEVKQGAFTNETLKWFTKIYDIPNTQSPRLLGNFWNSIIDDHFSFNIIDGVDTTKMRLKLMEVDRATLNEVSIHDKKYRLKDGSKKTLERVIDDEQIPF